MRLTDEVYLGLDRDDAALVAHGEYAADSFAAVVAHVDGALVDVHADVTIGEVGVEIPGKLHRVLQRLVAVFEGKLDRVADGVRSREHHVRSERTLDGVA